MAGPPSAMTLAPRITQRNTTIDRMFRRQCTPTPRAFPTNGLRAGAYIYLSIFRMYVCSKTIFDEYWSISSSDILIKTWDDTQISMLPTYKELIAAGLRIWLFRYIIINTHTHIHTHLLKEKKTMLNDVHCALQRRHRFGSSGDRDEVCHQPFEVEDQDPLVSMVLRKAGNNFVRTKKEEL